MLFFLEGEESKIFKSVIKTKSQKDMEMIALVCFSGILPRNYRKAESDWEVFSII
jgi:hypothetical protein